MRNMINLALEDDTIVDPTVVDTTEAGAGADSLETSLVEVNADAATVETTDTGLAQAEGAADALEDIAEAMQETIQEGGMSPAAANAVGVAVEAFYNQLGINKKPIVSLEHFGNTSSRVQSTRLAMEGIKETAKAIWDGIIKYIKKIADWIVAQYNKVFGAAEKLAKRAEALKARAGKDLPNTAKETKLENETLAKALHINGTVGNIAANMEKVAKTVSPLFSTTFESVETEITSNIDKLEKVAETGEWGTTEFKVNAVAGSASDNAASNYKAPIDGMKFMIGEELPGGKALVQYVAKEAVTGEAAAKVARAVSSKIAPVKQGAETKANAKFDVIANGDLEKVADTVIEISGQLKAFRNKEGKLKGLMSKASKAASTMGSKAEKETDAAKAKVISEAGKALAALSRQAYETQYSASVYALNVSKSALDALELSIKQYEASKSK